MASYYGQQPAYMQTGYSGQPQQTVQQVPQIPTPGAIGGPSIGYAPPAPIQNNVVTVRTKEEALYYPVGPGNSVIFRKEDGSSMYTKTMGYSTTEQPIFEEFIRVQPEEIQNETTDYKSEIEKIWDEINALKKQPHNQWKSKNEKRREDGSD